MKCNTGEHIGDHSMGGKPDDRGKESRGDTPSALSHTMRHFEERLGFRLPNRTTRSVSLTDAGLRLLDRLRHAVDQISRGLEDL